MAFIKPDGVNLVIDDLPDLLRQTLDYLMLKLEVNYKPQEAFYDGLATLVKTVHSLRIPIPNEKIEIEVVRCDLGLIVRWYYLEEDDDEFVTIDGGTMTVRTDNAEILTA